MPLRIISGKYKSRKINSLLHPDNKTGRQNTILRPTSDRARVMLFDILANKTGFSGFRCLDLFAGTGSFGFECLSRGAADCTFVDLSGKNLAIINKTAGELDCVQQTYRVRKDALDFLESDNSEYDLIFADPPYNYEHYEELAQKITGKNFCIGIIEFTKPGSIENFVKSGYEAQTRKAGITSFKILTDTNL